MKTFKLMPLFVLFFIACSKSSDPSSLQNEMSSGLNNGNGGNPAPAFVEEAKKYTEFACTVNNCAGTLCANSKGSCKAKACTALPDACTKIALTSAQIEVIATKHAEQMVADGYIDARDFDKSKNLAIQILRGR